MQTHCFLCPPSRNFILHSILFREYKNFVPMFYPFQNIEIKKKKCWLQKKNTMKNQTAAFVIALKGNDTDIVNIKKYLPNVRRFDAIDTRNDNLQTLPVHPAALAGIQKTLLFRFVSTPI